MLAHMKKLAGDDLAGRFDAWWNGRDYVPRTETEAEAEQAPAAAAEEPAPEVQIEPAPAPLEVEAPRKLAPVAANPLATMDGNAIRVRALETLWGEGRFAPGSFALDAAIVDAALELADRPGDVGFVGADAALLNCFIAQSDRKPLASEWRAACMARVGELAPAAVLSAGEVDRPRGFADGAMPAIVSIEAFAYADHKAGLVSRVYRALDEQGRWVFLDTTRRTNKTPPQAFASAWAEPQLATADEITELLTLSGFKTVRRISVADQVMAAAKQGYANLSRIIEQAGASGLAGREGALLLQELAWEAQSWRARMRAIEGGALDVSLWVADRSEREGPLSLSFDAAIQTDDAGAADTLFE